MNYNYIARYYDTLSRLFFLNRQQKAHKVILNYLKEDDRILWLGGGSGWFLKEIDRLGLNVTIDYVEVSSVMIEKAKKISVNHLNINFINEDLLKYKSDKISDIIITAFIFDHFKDEECKIIFDRFNESLIKGGKWIYIDFNEDQLFYQKILTFLMVVFFRIVAGIKNSTFPKVKYLFESYQLIDDKKYFNNYIESKVFKK